ncbi:MAG: hypothetical protein AAF934_08695, partial [Bacteroidota bacterium]
LNIILQIYLNFFIKKYVFSEKINAAFGSSAHDFRVGRRSGPDGYREKNLLVLRFFAAPALLRRQTGSE